MLNKPEFPLRVYYDGSCLVCAAEIEHYLKKDQNGRLIAIDISSADFDPVPLRITLESFQFELHAIDCNDQLYRNVEAFWAIWQAFPTSTLYGLLGTVITMPVVNTVARLIYKGFARIRPLLPKKQTCSSGTCRIDRRTRS